MKNLLGIILLIASFVVHADCTTKDANFIPVLAYHRIVDDITPGMTVVSESRFTNTMIAIKAAGFHTATISELSEHMECKRSLPDKTVVITFDDGWKDQLIAAKILKQFDMKATFYVMSGVFNDARYMTIQEIKELSKDFEIGAHSHTHFPHYHEKGINLSEMVGEIVISKKILSHILEKPVESYAWPYGYSTGAGIEYAKQLGMKSLVMINSQSKNKIGMSVHDIERINVYGNCTTVQIMKMLDSGKLINCK